MFMLRIYRGVRDHFPIRWTEWLMLYPAVGMWIAFGLDPNMFGKSPSFDVLATMATQQTWQAIIALVVVARLLALTINGTFHSFAYSPHIRAVASVIGLVFWLKFSTGLLAAWLYHGGALSGFVSWSTFAVAETANIYRSWMDTGHHLTQIGVLPRYKTEADRA